MLPLFLIITIVHVLGLAIIVIASFRAPFGYEDKDGFHTGRDEPDQSRAGSP